MKKAFTLIEVMVSIFLLSILVLASIKAYAHLTSISVKETIRYLALDKIDNEMSRLVYAYENKSLNSIRRYNYSFDTTAPIDHSFVVKTSTTTPSDLNEATTYNVYKTNPLDKDYGLKIDNSNRLNLIELKNNEGIVNIVDDGDIIGLLGFRTKEIDGNNTSEISLSLTYPYILDDSAYPVQLWNYVETVNLKTITKRK